MSLKPYQNIHPEVDNTTYIDPSAVIIGAVQIDQDCSIWPQVVIRGDVNQIRIGYGCSIQDGSVLHVTHRGPYNPEGFSLTLGKRVTVGHRVILHGCRIGNRVLVGMGSTIMDGATIEDDVILGANSLIPPGKRLPGGYLYIGSPARQQRRLTLDETKSLVYMADYYIKLKATYLD
jgi:carbonic anhydrase/acetyltransferase-like protein (isoleucine patch superfamily)